MQPYPPAVPSGGASVNIHTSYPMFAFILMLFKPKALVNGQELALVWGDNPISLPPGVHEIRVWVPYLWKMGEATITVDNRGGAASVYYAAPYIAFIAGAIDAQPVKPPGMALFIALMVVPFAFILLCCCCSALGSLGD